MFDTLYISYSLLLGFDIIFYALIIYMSSKGDLYNNYIKVYSLSNFRKGANKEKMYILKVRSSRNEFMKSSIFQIGFLA